MINPAELGIRPTREYKIFTDEQVKDSVRGQIEYIVGQIQLPVRAFFMADLRSTTYLFAMQGQQQYSFLENLWGDVVGKAEATRAQELAFETMKEFGFDPNRLVDKQSATNNGIVKKTLTYPSGTIGGLVFDRVEKYTLGSEKPFKVEWRARDDAHRFRIGTREKVKVA